MTLLGILARPLELRHLRRPGPGHRCRSYHPQKVCAVPLPCLLTAGSSCEPKDDKDDGCYNPNTDRYLRACREVVALNAFYLRVGQRSSHSCLVVCDSKSL